MAIWVHIRSWMFSILQSLAGRRNCSGDNIMVDNNMRRKQKVYSIPIDKTTYKSPNFSTRNMPIDSIIIHHTGGSFPGCAVWLSDPVSRVSAHYLITKQPQVFQLVADYNKAWHAGRGAFDVNEDGQISPVERMWNDRSIGIELEGINEDGYKYTTEQLHTLDRLVYDLCYEHRILSSMILGHKEISPGRKIDPLNFDMDEFRKSIKTMMIA